MARIVIDSNLKTIYHDNDGGRRFLGRTDYVGLARRHGVPEEAVRRACLDELVYTFVVEKAADFDVIETPDGVFYRHPNVSLPV